MSSSLPFLWLISPFQNDREHAPELPGENVGVTRSPQVHSLIGTTPIDKVYILADPFVQPLLEVLLAGGTDAARRSSRRLGLGAARARVVEVVAVGIDVKAEGAAVAGDAGDAVADVDVGGGVVGVVGGVAVEPVLRGGVAVAEDDGGQAGDGVGAVGEAPVGARLGGDEVGELGVADARGAVAVQVNGDVLVGAQVGSGEGGDGGAEGVAGGDDLVGRVLGAGGVDGVDGGGAQALPGAGEACVGLAAVNERVAAGEEEVEVGDPV